MTSSLYSAIARKYSPNPHAITSTPMTARPIEPRADRAEIRSRLASYAEIASISGRSRQIVRFWAAELAGCRNSTPGSSSKAMARRIAAKQIGDTGQFTNSWLKMNTAPPEFGEAVSPCLAAPYLFNGTSSSGPHECRLSANDDGCRCRRIVRVFPPLAQ
jgi:hypothetical protein